jgi:hypothetical protein
MTALPIYKSRHLYFIDSFAACALTRKGGAMMFKKGCPTVTNTDSNVLFPLAGTLK